MSKPLLKKITISFIVNLLTCYGLGKEQDSLMEPIYNFLGDSRIQLELKYPAQYHRNNS